ncbi:hypothetical protein FSP39_008557 [Pinctada imbricata]|uniref:Reverse transcriptase domain-containing protein n=1 Tax=Pinctada imbricata TaxID=66713 RepID=A0AA88XF46_PINIB|nr:hypothetical protein FSP39_008557 [Pinctada imbricata]
MLRNVGRCAIIARLDIKSAFRLIPINPSDFELLGFKISDYFFVDKCLPFGCSISCNLFEKFANFLEWQFKLRFNTNNVVHYLDDFLLAGESNTLNCQLSMKQFSSLCEELGIPLAVEKTLGPSTVLAFLGLEIDTNLMCVRIPDDKLNKLKEELSRMLNKKKTTLKELQSLTGLLNFCTRAIPAGRAFNRRFYDSMIGLSKFYHHVRINYEMKEDIRVWLMFLDFYNGYTHYDTPEWSESRDLRLFTDSAGNSKLGCGAIFQSRWAFLKWPEHWHKTNIMKDITFLEFIPIVMAFHIWGNDLANQRILLNTDNSALVAIINKKTSKSKRVMSLVRHFVLHSLLHNIQSKAIHVPGKKNSIADSLSRQEWRRFRRNFPQADETPCTVPTSLLDLISKIEPDC